MSNKKNMSSGFNLAYLASIQQTSKMKNLKDEKIEKDSNIEEEEEADQRLEHLEVEKLQVVDNSDIINDTESITYESDIVTEENYKQEPDFIIEYANDDIVNSSDEDDNEYVTDGYSLDQVNTAHTKQQIHSTKQCEQIDSIKNSLPNLKRKYSSEPAATQQQTQMKKNYHEKIDNSNYTMPAAGASGVNNTLEIEELNVSSKSIKKHLTQSLADFADILGKLANELPHEYTVNVQKAITLNQILSENAKDIHNLDNIYNKFEFIAKKVRQIDRKCERTIKFIGKYIEITNKYSSQDNASDFDSHVDDVVTKDDFVNLESNPRSNNIFINKELENSFNSLNDIFRKLQTDAPNQFKHSIDSANSLKNTIVELFQQNAITVDNVCKRVDFIAFKLSEIDGKLDKTMSGVPEQKHQQNINIQEQHQIEIAKYNEISGNHSSDDKQQQLSNELTVLLTKLQNSLPIECQSDINTAISLHTNITKKFEVTTPIQHITKRIDFVADKVCSVEIKLRKCIKDVNKYLYDINEYAIVDDHGIEQLLPLKKPSEMDKLDVNLSDHEYYLKMVRYLRKFKGTQNNFSPVLKKLATLPLLLQYNYNGVKGKLNFSELNNICKVLYDVYNMNTELDMNNFQKLFRASLRRVHDLFYTDKKFQSLE